jgi:hypothetical protein
VNFGLEPGSPSALPLSMSKLLALGLALLGAWGALANIAPSAFQVKSGDWVMDYLWGPKTIWVVVLLAGVLIGGYVLVLEGRLQQASTRQDPNITDLAKVVVDLMSAAQARPQPVAEPSRSFDRHNAQVVNELGALRHSGWKRYLEWIANYPDARNAAEKWRAEVVAILEKNYGRAVASRFNTPTTRESELTGVLNQSREHAFRVDRLGEIINDIVAGNIPANLVPA